jgi:putative tricarboxylic transport membrane protein
VLLSVVGPFMAAYAISFSPADYVALMVFAFASLASLVGADPLKTLIAALIGLVLATVGIDASTGVMRYTFGVPDIMAGVDFLVVIIGLFGIGELLSLVERQVTGAMRSVRIDRTFASRAELWRLRWTMARGATIGFFVGILPGTGATVAAAVAYGMEKRAAGDGGKTFGTGDPRGLVAPETANNAAAGGSFVPMLTLGIPGSGTTAMLLGALLLFNVQPGPMLFVQRPEIAWGLIASMYIGNVALLVINLPLVGLFARMLTIPPRYLTPLIGVLAFCGVFSVIGNVFDLYLAIALGVLGWFLRKIDVPLAPIVLGFVLGALFENNLRRALSISAGDWSILLESPDSKVLYALTALTILVPIVLARRRARAARAEGPAR